MSLPKLTSLSTKTLSLLLERQRMQTLPSYSPSPDPLSAPTKPPNAQLHLPQITRNLNQLRAGILEMEMREGRTEAVRLLRSQFERMRGMVGGEGVESLEPPPPPPAAQVQPSSSSSSSSSASSKSHSPSPQPNKVVPYPISKDSVPEPSYTPYADDPEAGQDPGMLLQTQRALMDEQDTHLTLLSHSINRQHHISIQINDELDTHTGLLQELDTDLDRTGGRLERARRGLRRVEEGVRGNGSTVTIALLILVLLILIIVFKT